MAILSTEEQKRDFIADEICKRIVGPGFAQDIYLTRADAEDEILVERPQIVYTSGILFATEESNSDTAPKEATPSKTSDEENSENLVLTPIFYSDGIDDDDALSDSENIIEGLGDDAEDKGYSSQSKEMEESLSDERAGFLPDRIGIITCLNADAATMPIKIKYGRYHLIPEKDWELEVKIALDERCPYDTLKERFDYYDRVAQPLLNSLGVDTVYDLFRIDSTVTPMTISPTRKLEVKVLTANNKEKTESIHPSDFPSTLRNKAASIICKIIYEGKVIELTDISWDDFHDQLTFFDSIKEVQDYLETTGWKSFDKAIRYDAASNKVSSIYSSTLKSGDVHLGRYLYEYDAVKEYILRNLLEYRFFKRQQHCIDVEIDLSKEGSEDIGDGLMLHWKPFNYSKKPDVKYLRVLLQNCTKEVRNSGKIPHVFQAEIYLDGTNIVTYSEPRVSSIDDEFNTNEVLYSDEPTYGKGVNCAVEWAVSEGRPLCVKTTYAPKSQVRSFSTQMDDTDITGVCNVHNLSIWGKSDDEIIEGLRKFASGYESWMKLQVIMANGDSRLAEVLSKQQEFFDRFNDNIDYLAGNDRAFRCFRIANTAMYIQMLLGRDPNFKFKGKDKSEFTGSFSYKDCWDYFKDSKSTVDPAYYPFQLAFLVMNIKSTFEANDPYRTDNVDLIWFPTGGGKTEAYLALTALTIAERRTSDHQNTDGVSVIMRYTLRLLTAQQFERASYLICAMEYLRASFIKQKDQTYSLGNSEITIGMWIGKATSPNKIDELKNEDKFKDFYRALNLKTTPITPELNPFPVVYCPWCGCNLVGRDFTTGYKKSNPRPADTCLNNDCHFHGGIPLYYIDEQLYDKPPTLLFATVDKFAQLNTKKAGQLLGVGKNTRKPDLIIQDELHLISGPLGSIVGLFETLVEELCTEKDDYGTIVRKPKIIASTATTRNTKRLGRQLYARDIISFPASGVRYSNNFFSHILETDDSLRLYMGLAPTGHTAAELEIRAIASELVAKEKMITEWLKSKSVSLHNRRDIIGALCVNEKLIKELDLYWTQVLYYMNLKSLGRTHSRISQEIKATLENMKRFTETYPELSFILEGFHVRNTEFTSRQNSAQIKQMLIKADEATQISESQPDIWRVYSQMDLVQATNMISVGIDIERWNVLMMVGQPLTTAEYIQASSRSGRRHKGLVVNLYNPMRSRELSYYENYASYHQVFYKFVEPLSATTFTEMTLDKLMLNLYVGYMVLIKNRVKIGDVTTADKHQFIEWLQRRAIAANSASIGTSIKVTVDNIFTKLQGLASYTYFSDFNKKKDLLPRVDLPNLMKSLREIDPNTYLEYE